MALQAILVISRETILLIKKGRIYMRPFLSMNFCFHILMMADTIWIRS